jgi:phosphoribosylformylglycinamidine synthase PurS subunit
MFKANVQITLRPSILDPQGKAVHHALGNLGYSTIDRVRMGKYVELWIDAATEEEAERVTRAACQKLLANPVMEDYTFTLGAIADEKA